MFNYKIWAYCFRKDSLINTNMHVEAMHKILKYIQRVTEISTLILTGNKTHQEQQLF
jgi:L-lysine 2,3-aminomutase